MNSIVIKVEFYFKGEKFEPCATVDLDRYFQAQQTIQFCYVTLAKAGNIGLHSHELDIMTMEPLTFVKATGLAEQFLVDGEFDWAGAEKAWLASKEMEHIISIANKFFSVEYIEEHPKLAAALQEAYSLGRTHESKESKQNKGLSEGFYG
ncbi:MAG: hypothetical protein R8M46_04110 [Ghiorsea sp.]